MGITDVDALVQRLFVEEGFHGDREDYYDPRNSSLIEVLGRRTGIPITLAVLCIEVGRRAGLALEPVGMPGHFLVHPVGSARHLDPFTGEMLDREQCERRFRESTGLGSEVAFDDAFLAPVATESVLVRMLANLRGIHRARGDLAQLGWVLRMRLALPGVSAVEVAELAENPRPPCGVRRGRGPARALGGAPAPRRRRAPPPRPPLARAPELMASPRECSGSPGRPRTLTCAERLRRGSSCRGSPRARRGGGSPRRPGARRRRWRRAPAAGTPRRRAWW